MNKRPLSVTVISGLFVVAGIVGVVYHAREFKVEAPFRDDVLWVCLVRLLAIVCGVFLFLGKNWARWALLGWIAYHVILSAFHSVNQGVVHGLLLAVIACFLLRPRASAYFLGAKAKSARRPGTEDTPGV